MNSLIACGLMMCLNTGLHYHPHDDATTHATYQDLKLTLEAGARECNVGDRLVLDVQASNHGRRTILLNGRLIPGDGDKSIIEPLNTPVLVYMTSKGADGKVREIRRLVRMKEVAELPADKKHVAPLFSHLDSKMKKLTPGLELEAPATAGTWLISCRLILPHPDPEQQDTIYVVSNEVKVTVK